MEAYQNLNGDSGVASYQLGDDYIIVEFKPNKYTDINFYKYTYASAGESVIEEMKRLAQQGRGLNSYINTDVKGNYESKGSSLGDL